MKEKKIYQLEKGNKIIYDHYGICLVDGIIPEFGVKIIPETKEGLQLLRIQTGMPDGTPILETSFRLIHEMA